MITIYDELNSTNIEEACTSSKLKKTGYKSRSSFVVLFTKRLRKPSTKGCMQVEIWKEIETLHNARSQ